MGNSNVKRHQQPWQDSLNEVLHCDKTDERGLPCTHCLALLQTVHDLVTEEKQPHLEHGKLYVDGYNDMWMCVCDVADGCQLDLLMCVCASPGTNFSCIRYFTKRGRHQPKEGGIPCDPLFHLVAKK